MGRRGCAGGALSASYGNGASVERPLLDRLLPERPFAAAQAGPSEKILGTLGHLGGPPRTPCPMGRPQGHRRNGSTAPAAIQAAIGAATNGNGSASPCPQRPPSQGLRPDRQPDRRAPPLLLRFVPALPSAGSEWPTAERRQAHSQPLWGSELSRKSSTQGRSPRWRFPRAQLRHQGWCNTTSILAQAPIASPAVVSKAVGGSSA